MLKNTEQNETPSHFSYKDYKKKVKKSPNRDVMVFASVFIVGLLIILGFAKILSPNVDVAISKESDIVASEDDNTSSIIDDRLRKLKQEDEGKKIEDEEMFSPELDEKVIIPTKPRKTVGEIEAEQAKIADEQETKQPEVEEKPKETKPAPQPAQIVNARVVVGYYATEKQAEVAKTILQDAGVGVTPIVKNLGGYYTLQVGSYSSKEKAQQAANSLLKSNFPARVITD
jgi:hypothetical protein